MGLFGNTSKRNKANSSSRQRQRTVEKKVIFHSPEEAVIYEQEQKGKKWHGVPLSELSRLAQTTYRGKYVKVDEYGFLLFYYSSKSGKTSLSVQCDLDENGRLGMLSHGHYPGQWTDSADDFIEKAKQKFIFTE